MLEIARAAQTPTFPLQLSSTCMSALSPLASLKSLVFSGWLASRTEAVPIAEVTTCALGHEKQLMTRMMPSQGPTRFYPSPSPFNPTLHSGHCRQHVLMHSRQYRICFSLLR